MQAPLNTAPASFQYRIVASLALLTLLAACGYKGPLYMPPPPPAESLTEPPSSQVPITPAASSQSIDAPAQTVPVQ